MEWTMERINALTDAEIAGMTDDQKAEIAAFILMTMVEDGLFD